MSFNYRKGRLSILFVLNDYPSVPNYFYELLVNLRILFALLLISINFLPYVISTDILGDVRTGYH